MRTIACLLVILSSILCAELCAAENARITPIVKVTKEWSPSVVNISTEHIVLLQAHPLLGQLGITNEMNFPNIPMGTMNLKSVGSGVIISKEGLILTNAHVVQMASKIFVLLSDGKQAEARLVRVR